MAKNELKWTEARILLPCATAIQRNDRLARNSEHIELVQDSGDYVIVTTRVDENRLSKGAEVHVWRTTICY